MKLRSALSSAYHLTSEMCENSIFQSHENETTFMHSHTLKSKNSTELLPMHWKWNFIFLSFYRVASTCAAPSCVESFISPIAFHFSISSIIFSVRIVRYHLHCLFAFRSLSFRRGDGVASDSDFLLFGSLFSATFACSTTAGEFDDGERWSNIER